MTILQGAFEGKVCFHSPVSSHYTAESSSKSPAHTFPWGSFLKAGKPILQPFLLRWVLSEHLDATLLGLLQCVIVSLVLETLKTRHRHSRCGLRSAELRGINEAMPGGFSSWEKSMFLNSAWMNTENERIVSAALVNQKLWMRCSIPKSLHQTATVLLSSCNLVVSSKLRLSCLPDEHKGRNVIQQEL